MMSFMTIFCLLWLCVFDIAYSFLNGSFFSSEQKLLRKLLKGYDATVRPRYNSSSAVDVVVRFSLNQIYDLDEKRQILTISGWLTLEWHDEFLTWKTEDYGNLKSIVVNPKKIWAPKVAIGNSANVMFHDWRHFWVTVWSNGSCRWQPGGNFAFTCALDMNYYPFDEQKCTMELETWYYTADKVNMTSIMQKFGMETFLQHGEWAVKDTQVESKHVVYGYYRGEAFPEVYLTIHMSRKYTFYFTYILLPCIMLSFVLLMVFLLPAESGEKVSFGVSILVSFSVFLLIVADQVPDTSDSVPVMAIYLMYFMMTTALSVIMSTIVLKLHYRGVDKSPPSWLRFLMFNILARLLCLHSVTKWNKQHKCKISDKAQVQTTQLNGDCVKDEMENDVQETTPQSALYRTLSLEFPENYRSTRYRKLSREISSLSSYKGINNEWKKISEVLDWLFFWIFLILILIPIVALLGLTQVSKIYT